MDIAALNSRITVQKNTVIVDKVGNHINRWEDYFSCYATVSGASGNESESAGTTNETENLDFTVRYCSELSVVTPSGYRVLFRGRIYDISCVDPMGFKNNSLKFKATLRKR